MRRASFMYDERFSNESSRIQSLIYSFYIASKVRISDKIQIETMMRKYRRR